MKMKDFLTLVVLLLTLESCVGCTDGTLRIESPSGYLQICKDSEWKYVCARDWGNLDAAVACRQLGYDGGYTLNTVYSRGTTFDTVTYHCSGEENSLQACATGSRSLCSEAVILQCERRNSSDPCSMGDIRLWGGKTECEGNIELCTNHGLWSSVSDSSWSNADAVVACRQLNYTGYAIPYYRSAFGESFQPMEYGGINCRGTESSLKECGISRTFVRTFSDLFFSNRRDYAGVKCIPRTSGVCTNGDVQLANGYSQNNGFAEVCIDGAWIGVCQSQYPEIPSLLCKQLGYPRYTSLSEGLLESNGSESEVYVSSFRTYQCRSESSILLDCITNSTYYGIPYEHSCTRQAILCCPDDVASCCLTGSPTTIPTVGTSPAIPTVGTSPTTSTVETSPTTPIVADVAKFSLYFGTAANSLIRSLSFDLRGLEEDIHRRIADGISEECDCTFDTDALLDGAFAFGDLVLYNGKVSSTDKFTAAAIVTFIKRSFDKNPTIQYRGSDLFLDVKLVEIHSD